LRFKRVAIMNTTSADTRQDIKAQPRTRDGARRELPEMIIQQTRVTPDPFGRDAGGERAT
jgi:hypothetical protein